MKEESNRRVVGYLLFKELDIERANALSGHFAYGTPSISGIKGAFHAISRKLMTQPLTASMKLSLRGVMVISHSYQLHASRAESFREYHFYQQKPTVSTYAEYKKMDAGTPPSITQKATISLKMSFVVEVVCDRAPNNKSQGILVASAARLIQQHRIAGGNTKPSDSGGQVQFIKLDELNSLVYKIPRGSILVSAQEEFSTLIKNNPSMSPTEVLINVCSIHQTPSLSDSGQINWLTERFAGEYGWVVPMMVGYHGISPKFEAGTLENSRSNEVPSQYVESIYSLGKWVSPSRLILDDNLDTSFWRYDYQPEKSLYLITTNTKKPKE